MTNWYLRWLLGAAVLLFLVYDSQNFFRSPDWSLWTLWISVPSGLVLGIWYLARNFSRLEPKDRFGLAVAAPFAAFGVIWVIVGSCLPSQYTAIFGEPVSSIAYLQVRIHSSGRNLGCRHRVTGEPFDVGVLRYFCADGAAVAKLPAAGRMRVLGKRSWFGLNATEVLPASAPP
jgi:hypothetical protein